MSQVSHTHGPVNKHWLGKRRLWACYHSLGLERGRGRGRGTMVRVEDEGREQKWTQVWAAYMTEYWFSISTLCGTCGASGVSLQNNFETPQEEDNTTTVMVSPLIKLWDCMEILLYAWKALQCTFYAMGLLQQLNSPGHLTWSFFFTVQWFGFGWQHFVDHINVRWLYARACDMIWNYE